MTTKAPSAVQKAPADSLENIAYASVAAIPTVEPNDQQRLGYHIWRWLVDKQGTIEEAVSQSGTRMKLSHGEAAALITDVLTKRGITIP